jgi:hypothetical protein
MQGITVVFPGSTVTPGKVMGKAADITAAQMSYVPGASAILNLPSCSPASTVTMVLPLCAAVMRAPALAGTTSPSTIPSCLARHAESKNSNA